MTYLKTTLMLTGLMVAGAVFPAFAGSQVDYTSKNPNSFNAGALTQALQLEKMINVSSLAQMNGLNAMSGLNGQMNLGQVLGNAVAGAIVSKLGIDNAMLSQIATGALSGTFQSGLSQVLGSGNFGALSSLGNMSTLGGLQGGLLGGGTSIGNMVINAAINQAVSGAVTQLLGGISGSGASSGGTSFDTAALADQSSIVESVYDTTSSDGKSITKTATYANGNTNSVTVPVDYTPTLSAIANVETTNINYIVGQGDGLSCTLDPNYMTSSGVYDANYLSGYRSACSG